MKYDQRQSAGLCVRCEAPNDNGHAQCHACLEALRGRVQRFYTPPNTRAWNVCCQSSGKHRVGCDDDKGGEE